MCPFAHTIDRSVGPMKMMPSSSHVRGNAGFSEAWPHPGQTASHECSFAMEVITETLASDAPDTRTQIAAHISQ